MDTLRSWLGVSNNQHVSKQRTVAKDPTYLERERLLIQATQTRIEQHEDELEEVSDELKIAIAAKDAKKAQSLLTRKRTLLQELSIERGKLHNQRGRNAIISQGESHLEDAYLTRQAATRVQDIEEQMHELDIEEAIDDLRDGRTVIMESGRMLSKPMLEIEEEVNEHGETVEEELARLMMQEEEEETPAKETTYVLPSVPTKTPGSGGGVRAGTTTKHSAVKRK